MKNQGFPGIPKGDGYHEVKDRKGYADKKSAEEEVPKKNDFLAFHGRPGFFRTALIPLQSKFLEK